MIRRLLVFLLLFTPGYLAIGQGTKVTLPFNPTGTYRLANETYVRHGDTYGYTGTIRVKLIKPDRIAVSLYICKGAPSYNLGSFVDTLVFRNHRAVYHHAEDDTSCRITFRFTSKGVTVGQVQADLDSGCDFGHAVFADGYYKKVSGKVPVIRDEDE